MSGRVSFVGAGPGDPRLLTLRGAELVSRADVVVFEAGVHEETLALAPKDAPRHEVSRAAAPEAIGAQLATHARAGHHVVRLFVGDPFAFRGGVVELGAVRAAGLPVEVVAGVIAPTAAAAYTGLALSRVDDASPSVALAVVGDVSQLHDWSKLSLATDTLALIVDVAHLEEITQTLTYYGRAPTTPAAFVRDVSLPSQKVVLDTLVGIRAHLGSMGSGHGLLLVGEAIAAREPLRWFELQPLFGKRVLVTRAEGQAQKTAAMLRERGAEPLVEPTIAFEAPTDPALLRKAIASLRDYGFVLFTSENGVRFFWESLTHQGLDARALGNARLGAIGPGTAQALEAHGVRADVVAKEFRGEGLAQAVLDAMGSERPRVLLARAEEAREVLPDTLRSAGCVVDVVPAYVTRGAPGAGERLRELFGGRGVDAVMFTSASTVSSFCDALGPGAKELLATVRVASIGPITTEAAQKRGLEVAVTASPHTLPALVDALEASYRT